jgi:hypothetical protein
MADGDNTRGPGPAVRAAFQPLARMGDSATPAAEMTAAVMACVAAWNAAMPARRVRVVTQTRYLAAVRTLSVYTAGEVCSAIAWYAGRAWNRRNNAWRHFEDWVDVDNLTRAVERIEDERADAARRAAGPAPAGDECEAEKRRLAAGQQQAIAAVRARWEALSDAERADRMSRARAAMAEAGMAASLINDHAAAQRAMAEMERG